MESRSDDLVAVLLGHMSLFDTSVARMHSCLFCDRLFEWETIFTIAIPFHIHSAFRAQRPSQQYVMYQYVNHDKRKTVGAEIINILTLRIVCVEATIGILRNDR